MRQRFLKAAFVAFIVGIGSVSADVVVESFDVISSDPQENLFATIGQPTVAGLPSGIGVTEEWPVTINMVRLQSLPGTIVLNLPNQVPDPLNRIRSQVRGTDGFLWTGGGEGCSALLSAIPGAFRATISCLSGTYAVETTPSGPRLARYSYGPPPAGSEYDVARPPSAGASTNRIAAEEPIPRGI